MATGQLEDRSASVEVGRFDSPSGPRLRVKDLVSGAEIYLDPIELEGLTRLRSSRPDSLRSLVGGDDHLDPSPPADLETMQNEFAMVQIGRIKSDDGTRLYIRDLASRAETTLLPIQLQGLTKLRHRQLAPLLDPSDLVAAMEPDPDQV
jgi:hypothetical protein